MGRVAQVYKNISISGFVAVMPLLAGFGAARAQEDITAGSLLERLSAEEQVAYMAGVVEGLAYARYERDGKTSAGAKCITNWLYQTEGTMENIVEAFGHFADYTPAAVIAAMVKEDCGE